MSNLTYFRMVWKMNRGFTLFSMISLGILQILILHLVTTFDTQAILNSVFNQLPPNVKMFMSDGFFRTLTVDGAAAFGYNHPMVIALIVVNAINIPVRHISRELESGTLELLLAQPFKRESLIVTLWISGLFILGLIVLTAFLSSIFAIHIFHELTQIMFYKVVQISVNMWLFSVCVMTGTLLISTVGRAGSITGNLSAMIIFVFYIVFIISQLWDEIKFSQSFNIFSYYEPSKLMLGQGHFWRDNFVMTTLTAIFLVGSLWFFKRRDIP